MKKRILALLLACLMICTLPPIGVSAEDPISETLVKDGTVVLTEGKRVTLSDCNGKITYYSFTPTKSGDYLLNTTNCSTYIWSEDYDEYVYVGFCFNTLTAGKTYYFAAHQYGSTDYVCMEYQNPVKKITVTKVPDTAAKSIVYNKEDSDYQVKKTDERAPSLRDKSSENTSFSE